MRFRLVSASPWSSRLLNLHVRDVVVSVGRQYEGGERITWTWWDGTEYAVLRPEWPDSLLRIISMGEVVCSGRLFLDSLIPRMLSNRRVTFSKWDFCGQTVTWELGHRGWKVCANTNTLRIQDGIRLAFFTPETDKIIRLGHAYHGVIRDGLPDGLVATVFAIILAGLHVHLWMSKAGD